MSTDFYCKVCDIHCTGSAPYRQHLDSVKHLKKAKTIPSETSTDRSSPTPISISTSNESASSASFAISNETMRILLEWNHPSGLKPYCDICYLPLYGDKVADVHFTHDNNIHHQKQIALEQIRTKNPDYSCKICSEIFTGERQMHSHFASDAHETVRQQKTDLEKIIKIYETYNRLKEARKQRQDSVAHDNLSNQFDTLKIADESTLAPVNLPISPEKFESAMRNRWSDDD
ncbi:unnamed protein product [Adineta ricciae]|uniref:C2H2-type domain-containing protein n=1 Tax=Adineta ricciae TaxID=249248 RepID=A0A813R4M3_ADIRI|nr:unnamed protein product [Adineta ricciae]CAF1596512.1 unnamed protein product [Adineta ricciae]